MLTRKRFLAVAGSTGAAGALAACGGGSDAGGEDERRKAEAGDREIIRYFLRLETIENAFWSTVAERNVLAGLGLAEEAAQIARNEAQHLDALSRFARRLGDEEPPVRPETKFDSVFAAGPEEVLAMGATLENLSAAAYLGQINRLQDRTILASVLAIHTVEGRQAAALNRRAGRGFSLGTGQLEGALPDGAFAEPLDMDDVRVSLRRYAEDA
jgi:hypothetical protein